MNDIDLDILIEKLMPLYYNFIEYKENNKVINLTGFVVRNTKIDEDLLLYNPPTTAINTVSLCKRSFNFNKNIIIFGNISIDPCAELEQVLFEKYIVSPSITMSSVVSVILSHMLYDYMDDDIFYQLIYYSNQVQNIIDEYNDEVNNAIRQ